MGLDLGVVEGDEVFFGERMSSYSGFDDFRQAWARLLGFNLEAEAAGHTSGMCRESYCRMFVSQDVYTQERRVAGTVTSCLWD